VKILKAKEMRDIDRKATAEYDIPSILLMENAGIKTTEVIKSILQTPGNKNVTILVGKGNNGGDGLVVARQLLNWGLSVDVFITADTLNMTRDSAINYQILDKMGAKIFPLKQEQDFNRLQVALLKSDLIVDALYGIGFKGGFNEFESKVVKIVNNAQIPIVAVDIPSGVDADTGRVHGDAIRASNTVTFALPKLGLILEPGKGYAGSLTVADITIPASLLTGNRLKNNLIDEDFIKPLIKERPAESHKGTYGHALIIGGSVGLSGAVGMAACAALRCGAGLVTAAIPESLLDIIESKLSEVMTTPLAQTNQGTIGLEALPAIENLLGTVSVCAIGPGMSGAPEVNSIVRYVLQKSGVPVVVDADGLNAIKGDISILKDRQVPVVLTPHPGEMARLTGMNVDEIQSDRIRVAGDFAKEWGATLVLKGNNTVVANPSGEIYVNITGNPGMATAGSGDVLCGIITGLISQGLKPQDAAVAGVFLHGMAGDYAAERKGQRGLVAGDLTDNLPAVLKYFESI
jgi:NAD(P)H-hydrate epimerase